MLNKIYLVVIVVATLINAVLVFYAHSWLGSISKPENVIAGFDFYASLSWTAIWLAAIALLGIANVLLWKTGRIRAMWASLVFFVLFVVVHTFWLSPLLLQYKEIHNLPHGSFSASPFLGVIASLLAAIIVFFDQYLVLRLRAGSFPPEKAPVSDADAAG